MKLFDQIRDAWRLGKAQTWYFRFATLCLLLLYFCPHHGPPHFRYTGSNPARPVWNFGCSPVVTFIYDPGIPQRIALSPLAIPAAVFFTFVLAALRIGMAIVNLREIARWEETQTEDDESDYWRGLPVSSRF